MKDTYICGHHEKRSGGIMIDTQISTLCPECSKTIKKLVVTSFSIGEGYEYTSMDGVVWHDAIKKRNFHVSELETSDLLTALNPKNHQNIRTQILVLLQRQLKETQNETAI